MYSKKIKRAVWFIDTMIMLGLAVLALGSDLVKDMSYYEEMFEHPDLSGGALDWIIFMAVIFVVPLVLLFTFIMRAVDWHREEIDGGYVWILGVILAVVCFSVLIGKLFEKDADQQTVFAVTYGVSYLVCLIGIFVPHIHSSGSSYEGGSGYSSSDDGCPGGGCY